MATDIGDLNARLTANGAQLDKDLAAAQAKLTTFADKASAGIKDFSSNTGAAFAAVRTSSDLMRGKFESTGDALGMMGSIAATIPGPWGVAAGAIFSTLGGIVDWLEGRLLRSQHAARAGFLSLASGARTASGAMSDIALGTINEGLERMSNLAQRRVNLTEIGRRFGFEGGSLPFLQNVGEERGNEMERVRTDMRTRLEMFRQLQNDPQMRELRGQAAGVQAGEQLEEMARSPRLGLAQRTLSRSLRGEHFDEQAVQTSLAAIALDRYTSQGVRPTAEQEAVMTEQVRRATRVLREQHAALASDRLATTVRESNEGMTLQAETFQMSAREADIYRAELQQQDVQAAMTTAAWNTMTMAQRDQWMQEQRNTAQGIETMRANDRAATARERLNALQQTQTGGAAQQAFLREQQEGLRGQFQFTVDMTREQAELDMLRLRGAEDWRVALAAANMEQVRAVRLQTAMAQASLQMTQANLTPMEQFENAQRRAQDLFARGTAAGGIDFATYARELERASAELERASGPQQGGGTAMLRGSREAVAAINRNNRRVEGDTAQARVQALLADIRNAAQRQQRDIEEVARNTAPARIRLVLAPAQLE